MITSSKSRGFSLCVIVLVISISCVSKPADVPGRLDSAAMPPSKAAPEPTDTPSILAKAAELLGRREFAEALALFDRIPAEDAEKPEIQLLKASALNAAGHSAGAKEIANKLKAENPANTGAIMILADAAALEGNDRERRALLEQVIKADPKHIRALCDLGNIALQGQSLRAAANYFDQALAADGNSGEALIGRAMVYRYSRQPKLAEQLFNQAIKLYPQWASPRHERARLYKGAGFNKEALADLDIAKKLAPGNYWIIIDRGIALVELNHKSEALEEFNSAIAMDPDNFLAYVYSAGIKNENGDWEGAERDFGMLTKLKPEYYFAFEGLGMIKMRRQQWTEARDAFLEAYKYAPKEYNYALLAAASWMKGGRPNDPKQFLAQVLRTVPRDSLEYTMLRLYHDMSGDLDAAVKVDREQNLDTKARMLFYLAFFYDIRGNKNLADKYFLQVQELSRMYIPEWRLNEWFIEERGIKAF